MSGRGGGPRDGCFRAANRVSGFPRQHVDTRCNCGFSIETGRFGVKGADPRSGVDTPPWPMPGILVRENRFLLPLNRYKKRIKMTDIRDIPNPGHEAIVDLNFIRSRPTFVFRRHFRSGMRSLIMEVLDPAQVQKESQGVVCDGIRCFPRADPRFMLRLFRKRFDSWARPWRRSDGCGWWRPTWSRTNWPNPVSSS